ncbi:unnamed protein product [Rhizoctonia solani]|uniref:Protein kinase domain-containing protein n=1 Tax=Rhizoctonia solani TaxID=456999 RepID=A0A8H2W849_9AGAM|nr:unnamed protein product [Rhizoctonia solani]
MSSATQSPSLVVNESLVVGSTIMIGKDMSTSDILKQIGTRVEDITIKLNLKECNREATEHGGSGSVYSGRLNDGSRVAIKCLKLEINQSAEGRQAVESFANELYVWSKCQHLNVIGLIGMASYRGRFAMISPWMENGSVKRFLSNRSFSRSERLQLCLQIASGVAYLHANKIASAWRPESRECINV